MITKELVEYVNGQRALGKVDADIKRDLLSQGGWSAQDLEEVFFTTGNVPAPDAPRKGSPKIFLIIAAIVLSLGISAYVFLGDAIYRQLGVGRAVDSAKEAETKSLPAERLGSGETPEVPVPVSTSTALSDDECGDAGCFIKAIETCSKARYTSDSSVELLGSDIKSKLSLSLSQANGQCLLSIYPLSYAISPSQGLTDAIKGAEIIGPGPNDIYPKLNADAQLKIVRKTGICNITKIKNEVIELAEKSAWAFLLVEPDYESCSGELFAQPDTASDKNAAPVVRTVADCDSLSSFDRQRCVKQLAVDQKDVSICSQIVPSNSYSSIQSDCYGDIATLKNDYGICSKDNFDKLKNDGEHSRLMQVECLENYCASYNGPDKWVWCAR